MRGTHAGASSRDPRGVAHRLVHEYDASDDGKVVAAIGPMLDLYPAATWLAIEPT